jgi:DMSO/TMAO reductase YedYZ molybdopterin-dependent catalytic subunit
MLYSVSMARPRLILLVLLITVAAGTLAAEERGNPNAAPPKVDMSTWRLDLAGEGLGEARAWTYEELLGLPMVKKREQLVCPGLFAYYAVWEGVPLVSLLEAAKVAGDYSKVTLTALDGYSVSFTREEVEKNLLFLAVRVYDKTLPPAEGFPVRLVAEGFSGGKWVRWLKEIRVQ